MRLTDVPNECAKRHRRGDIDGAIGFLFSKFDQALRHGEWSAIEQVLSLSICHLPTDIILAVLTITVAAKDKLKLRPWFFQEAKRIITRRGDCEDGLLHGLE